MSKEMIISVNGREKKIAILDNGKVTEFYIERGEENSGVVGNIYKGRVQRVLPGMQSAFVDIGLERDAFLYVSDFFDEEEEIERIVMEKSKKGSPEEAKREAVDLVERARLEREKQMEDVQDIAEPMAETITENVSVSDEEEEIVEQIQPQAQSNNKRRDRNRGRREKPQTSENSQETTEFSEAKQEVSEEISAPIFEYEDSGFERVIDLDDEETTGEIFKDAYIQEAIIDKVRAIEFDMEPSGAAEVGSFINSVVQETGGFERIADEDEEVAEPQIETGRSKNNRRNRGGKSKNKSAQNKEEVKTVEVEAAPEPVEEIAPKAETKDTAKSKTSRKSSRGKKSEEKAEEVVAEPAIVAEAEPEAAPKSKSSRGKKSNRNQKKTAKTEGLEDSEASVKESSETSEMAVRRGGRGRRRGGRGRRGPGEGLEDGESENLDISEIPNVDFEAVEPIKQEVAPILPPQSPREPQNNRNRGYQGGNPRAPRDSRNERETREPRDNRNDRDSRDNRRSQPTISDLLREGQEILVQIAKEPIARKGARITSHIALPGRFLVYMPTIEHLGVSRKIESASERSRLRTFIQRIKQEEDVPTGGFIVRTAGVGITEDDLRQDARYLVRTWHDIKKSSEKKKSPALVHQDLDIIQRILRDQLSEEFTAIRVDSEEEYLRIVEFINRIQPRMVNRVKLYTREDPILETYGVQEEVDKALKPRVWLKSGGYLVLNQTEALVAIDVNTGKFVGKGNARLEDTITKTNMEAVDEIARQIRLRDLGGIIVLDLIDMEDRRNRNKVAQALQEALSTDKSPTKVLSFNDFGLIIMTRKRVKQSLERTMCAPCEYCEGAGWIKSPQTICYEILEEARRLSKSMDDVRQTTLRVHTEVAEALRKSEKEVLEEIEAYLGNVDVTSDQHIHQAQFDFAFI